jgi:hypothetical protein
MKEKCKTCLITSECFWTGTVTDCPYYGTSGLPIELLTVLSTLVEAERHLMFVDVLKAQQEGRPVPDQGKQPWPALARLEQELVRYGILGTETEQPLMALWEIRTGMEGASYERFYVWTADDLLSLAYRNLAPVSGIRKLFTATAKPFSTQRSDSGWEINDDSEESENNTAT